MLLYVALESWRNLKWICWNLYLLYVVLENWGNFEEILEKFDFVVWAILLYSRICILNPCRFSYSYILQHIFVYSSYTYFICIPISYFYIHILFLYISDMCLISFSYISDMYVIYIDSNWLHSRFRQFFTCSILRLEFRTPISMVHNCAFRISVDTELLFFYIYITVADMWSTPLPRSD